MPTLPSELGGAKNEFIIQLDALELIWVVAVVTYYFILVLGVPRIRTKLNEPGLVCVQL